MAATLPPGTQPRARHRSTGNLISGWVGDWDVFETGNPTKVADARVDRILDGCVLHEDYRDVDGHQGQSFTTYDAARRVWHQSWVTNRGESLEIEGNVGRGDMVLAGEDRAAGTLL